MTRNKGFTIVEVVIVVVVIGLIGLIGWRVWDANQTASDTSPSETTTTDIKTEKDLDTADQTLDEMNVEGNEAKQLDTETSF